MGDASALDIEALIRREEQLFHSEQVRPSVAGKTVLITGAGGTIGSELCRQLLRLDPDCLLLLDHSEHGIYCLHQALQSLESETTLVPLIADVRDKARMTAICQAYQPDIICHVAAYKHVPLMESQPDEAVTNNICGTLNLLEVATDQEIRSFVLVSTDKAVQPVGVMGATKRVAELFVSAFREQTGYPYLAVRFGNVLQSNGSVIPRFLAQIEAGGPVTVTDRRMLRYFMTVREAAQLILKSLLFSDQADLFVSDMGTPVKIIDLAQALIDQKASGESIKIVETGIRPGERLEEVYLTADEFVKEQIVEGLFIGQNITLPLEELMDFIEQLTTSSPDQLKKILLSFVNNYH
ncbi:SDR family NAD(P)-dependent oxidoreductase [Dolosigranulum pigrum]|uniref:SDR family NAD(P)-dependent oxidoreductase n=1 Tax=Dolosigranulum pigrum TaxID=29394 RepID=UPI001AD863CF|nr:SDR family NAD(P)-dependent oxidoreductase [Dolosigranulum pigrum]QTJ36210.1 polysaccharide biosynthesis protein [Dolosigranulum pigrum]